VDAGTGLTASTLVAGFSLSDHDAQVHIVPVASESEEILVDRMERRYWPWILELDASLVPLRDCNIRIHSLLHDRSFGSVSASLVSYIRSFAVRYGVLLDPIYSAKLFRHAEHVIQSEKLRGNILIIHSGGAQTLAGFDQFMQSTSYRV
jgi:1-aminocyclopropane-1-carboxylate deaminase/D-cysteine desulfhydrase